MIPVFLKLKIPRTDKPERNIYLPLFLAWILFLPILLLLLPFFLLGAILLWAAGYGRVLLFVIPILIYLLWNLSGLKIDFEDKNDKIYLSFI